MSVGRTVDTLAPEALRPEDLRRPGHPHLCRCFDCFLWRADAPKRRRRDVRLARQRVAQKAWRARRRGLTAEQIVAEQVKRRVELVRVREARAARARAATVEAARVRREARAAFVEFACDVALIDREDREHQRRLDRLVREVARVRAACERGQHRRVPVRPDRELSAADRLRAVNRESARRRYVSPLPVDDPRHGKASTRKNWGCKCEACVAADVADRERRSAVRAGGLADGDRRHGTLAGYSGWRCRCGACAAAGAEARAVRRAARKAEGLPVGDVRHGTASGYNEWCCRCVPCREYNTAVCAAWKANRRSG